MSRSQLSEDLASGPYMDPNAQSPDTAAARMTPQRQLTQNQMLAFKRSRQHLAAKSSASLSNRSRPTSAMHGKAYSHASEQKLRPASR